MSPITTHVLDTSLGKPAAAIVVTLEFESPSKTWSVLAQKATDADGRVKDLLPTSSALQVGRYRLNFNLEPYFKSQSRPSFFPIASLTFDVTDPNAHYHVPLLTSGFGFSTYRGS